MTRFKKEISIIISCLIFVISLNSNVFAATGDKLEIMLELGKSSMMIDGDVIKIGKPFISKNVVFVPLRAICEAFGAEVEWKGNGKINITYGEKSIDIIIGKINYTVNQVEKKIKSAPININKTAMIPLEFLKDNFLMTIKYDASKKTINILLEDDGALSDLSFLTDSISKPMIGNSYFGWRMNIPNGSRIKNSSFNSKYICIDNENRGMYLEITTGVENTKKIDEYYEKIIKNPKEFLGSDVLDSSVNKTKKPEYAEFLYINENNESVFKRVYINQKSIYTVVLTSYYEPDPKKVKESDYYRGIMDSFKIGYSGNISNVYDLSKVKYGFVKYENYLTIETSYNKYLTWGIDVLPEWDILITGNNPLSTRIGSTNKEYISINIDANKDIIDGDIEQYTDKIAEKYRILFNPEHFKYISKGIVDIGGYKANKIAYSLDIGGAWYKIDEYYIYANELLYNITVKSPEDKYKSNVNIYDKMLEKFKISTLKTTELKKDIEGYSVINNNIRIGKDENITGFQNKKYKWEMMLPGFWTKVDSQEERIQIFLHPDTDLNVMVEVVENTSQSKLLQDSEKFGMMNMMIKKYNMKKIQEVTNSNSEQKVRGYTYRLESKENEAYADVNFNIYESEEFSYCLTTVIGDIYASEKNIKEINDIIASFKITK